MRNFLVHEYFNIDRDILEEVITNDLDPLSAAVERGELPADTDLPLLLDQLYYRFVVTRETTDVDFVRRHLAALMRNTAPAPHNRPA